jgi:hypothetical protein
MYARYHYDREQALRSVYRGSGLSVLLSWLSPGGVTKLWAAITSVVGGSTSALLTTASVYESVDTIDALCYERHANLLRDFNNCMNNSIF